MVTEQLIWLIFLLPLISFFICSVIVRQLFNHHSIIAGYTAIILIGLSFLISVLAFYEVIINHNEITNTPIEWLTIGKFSLSIGLLLDPLTIVMLTVVTGVSLMVQIYSLGYMKGEDQQSNHSEDPAELGQPVLSRYFSYMSLFTASMLGLILASKIIQLFIENTSDSNDDDFSRQLYIIRKTIERKVNAIKSQDNKLILENEF